MYMLTGHIKSIQGTSEATSALPLAPVQPHREPQPRAATVRTALADVLSRASHAVAVG